MARVQQRRPLPVAETGRNCWGSGLQDASAAPRHEADAGCRNPSGPAHRNRCVLAALNTRHLLRKPVCGLKTPLGLSRPPGTAVLSGSLLCGKREQTPPRCSTSKSLRPCRAEHAAFASQTGLRLKSPTGAFMPCGHRRPFWFSFATKREQTLAAMPFAKGIKL